MRTALLDYDLPDDLIARRPPAERDGGRMLVVRRGGLEHRRVREWVELVPPGALVVLNDTRVLPARLLGRRAGGGGRVELLLLERLGAAGERERWRAIGHANRPLRPGAEIDAGELRVTVGSRGAGGSLEIELVAAGGVGAALERSGHVPLPPYLGRPDEPDDRVRYQTVYAAAAGSAAAPTAGLHLTEAALERLVARGVEIARVTLHVGLGTFRPVTVEELSEHVMHAERFEIGAEAAEAIRRARARGGPVVAAGTTVVRALESAADPAGGGVVLPGPGETRLLVQPGHRFAVIDALLTNLHQPRSTLLALVAAFGGLDAVRAAYREAVAARYRFLSYGDAMWFPERGS
ncbi:MAG: tRNA preQ1(34) S-adenosylmethionine ribosyltransferase-isomerase QueA [Polyangiaceae bacterium]|nr:tRNA preQ1(34) S-adenosylmethionine ribosyltransferase-isomerase QueA [Polyangiaceae bacterium]